MSHVDKNAVRAAYNQSIYLEQRRVLMSEWATIVELSAQGVTWERIRIASEAGRPLESLQRLL